MRFVLDASVAVAFLRPGDVHYERAVAFVRPVLTGIHSIVVPSIFEVEVSAALARASVSGSDIRTFVGAFLDRAEVITLGPKAARKASRVAQACKLRGMDAIYVWLAQREEAPLVTFDLQVLERAGASCEVVCP
jgi:predicted nucleic acid-binding protein